MTDMIAESDRLAFPTMAIQYQNMTPPTSSSSPVDFGSGNDFVSRSTKDASLAFLLPHNHAGGSSLRPLGVSRGPPFMQRGLLFLAPISNTSAMPPQSWQRDSSSSGVTLPTPARTRSNSDRSDEAVASSLTFIDDHPKGKHEPARVKAVHRSVMKHFIVKNKGDPRRKRQGLRSSRSPNSDAAAAAAAGNSTDALADVPPDTERVDVQSSSEYRPASSQQVMTSGQDHITSQSLGNSDVTTSDTTAASMAAQEEDNTSAWASMFVIPQEPLQKMEFVIDELGRRIGQFSTWPRFAYEHGAVHKLKIYCTCRFGSRQLEQYWLPEMLKSSEAFYSTIYISATHDDLIEKEVGPNGLAHFQESRQRIEINNRLVQMITRSIQQQATEGRQITDGTVMAVLHVFYGEIMKGDREQIQMHQKGLDDIVGFRGGLGMLGVKGQLALTLVIVSFLLACMQETVPGKKYSEHADSIETWPPRQQDGPLSSPIYTAQPYDLNGASIDDGDRVAEMLELTRLATCKFQEIHHPGRSRTSHPELARRYLDTCYAALLNKPGTQGQTNNEAGMYETVRLTCCVFVHALVYNIPLSQAALDDRLLGRSSICGTNALPHNPPFTILERIREALARSTFRNSWKKKSGILLWCGLVALAAANSIDAPQNQLLIQRLNRARDFVAAVTMRAAIFHVFGYPSPLLGMLRQFVAIQQVLAVV